MSDQEKEVRMESKKMVKTFLTDEEHRQLRHAAAEADMNLADYIRDAVMKAVKTSIQEYLEREIKKKNSGQDWG